jgi:hypothetical protein
MSKGGIMYDSPEGGAVISTRFFGVTQAQGKPMGAALRPLILC